MRKDRELPQSVRRGVSIDELDPQPAIREVSEKNRAWDYSAEATKLYRRADVMLDELYPVIHTPQFQGRLPSVLIGVGDLRNKKTLAAYNLVPDDYGLNFKITFNEKHYVDGKDEEGKPIKVWKYGEWAQMETLCHELGHHAQQMLGKDPYKPGKRVTHNKEFNDKMEV